MMYGIILTLILVESCHLTKPRRLVVDLQYSDAFGVRILFANNFLKIQQQNSQLQTYALNDR